MSLLTVSAAIFHEGQVERSGIWSTNLRSRICLHCDLQPEWQTENKHQIPHTPSLEEKKTLGKHSKGKNFQAALSMQYLRYRLFFHAEIKLPKTQKCPSKSIYMSSDMILKVQIWGIELGIYQIKVKVKLRGEVPKKKLMPFWKICLGKTTPKCWGLN